MGNRSFTVLDSSAGRRKNLISSKSSVVTWAIPGKVEDRNDVGPRQRDAKKKVNFRSDLKFVRRHNTPHGEKIWH